MKAFSSVSERASEADYHSWSRFRCVELGIYIFDL